MQASPAPLKKKICLLGSFAVGKTSLVRRFVSQLFSDTYHTTLGVKVDKKIVSIPGREVTLMIWDIAGQDEFFEVPPSYLMGAAGYLLVLDGTRRATLDAALILQQKIHDTVNSIPFVLLTNKCDLKEEWEISQEDLTVFHRPEMVATLQTSARTGQGVEEAFLRLARQMAAPTDATSSDLDPMT